MHLQLSIILQKTSICWLSVIENQPSSDWLILNVYLRSTLDCKFVMFGIKTPNKKINDIKSIGKLMWFIQQSTVSSGLPSCGSAGPKTQKDIMTSLFVGNGMPEKCPELCDSIDHFIFGVTMILVFKNKHFFLWKITNVFS